MSLIDPNSEAMKRVLKEALAETLHEQRELLHEIFVEVLEDVALAEAIREGRQTELVDRDKPFRKEALPELLSGGRGMWKDRDDLPDTEAFLLRVQTLRCSISRGTALRVTTM